MGKPFSLLAALLLAASCASPRLAEQNAVTPVEPLPHRYLVALSEESHRETLETYPRSAHTAHAALLEEVGQRLTKAVVKYLASNGLQEHVEGNQWRYALLASDQVMASCLPGGQIVFHEGMIPYCEGAEGVAAVMAHTVAHAISQHGDERLRAQLTDRFEGASLKEAHDKEPLRAAHLVSSSFGLVKDTNQILPYRPQHEAEADEIALYFMALAGYDPRQAPAVWARLAAGADGSTFLRIHPCPADHEQQLRKHMKKAVRIYRQHNRAVARR
ncbi:MAG: M48 family metallopeptidase [Catalinimonas sp.]